MNDLSFFLPDDISSGIFAFNKIEIVLIEIKFFDESVVYSGFLWL